MSRMECPKCGNEIGDTDQTCQKCGAQLSYTPDEQGVHCSVCDTEIGGYTETCPECGETGYPALRPRKGKGWKGAKPEGLPREG